MNKGVGMRTMRGTILLSVALTFATSLLAGGRAVLAQSQPDEADILKALTSGTTRRAHHPASDGSGPDQAAASADRQFIDELIGTRTRAPTLEDKGKVAGKVADIIERAPRIDLEVTFDFNQAVIGPQAVGLIVKLGRALSAPELKGATFIIAGYTDAAGSYAYNQALSDRRAEAVKAFLAQNFNIRADHLFAIGYGKTHLKNGADPLAAENRRVNVANVQ